MTWELAGGESGYHIREDHVSTVFTFPPTGTWPRRGGFFDFMQQKQNLKAVLYAN